MTEGWKRTSLGSVLSIQNGYAFDSKAFGSAGMPLIRIRDLKSGTSTETKYVGEFDPRYVVNAGDLLVGMDGEFACYEWKGEPALLNQRVCRLQGFSDALNPRFLFYGINKHLKAIEDVTGFTTVKHLSSRQILGIEFLVPPKDEQRRIVAILDEAFEAIVTAKANTEKNLQSARELFARQLQALLSAPQPSWVASTLGATYDVRDGTHDSPKYHDHGWPLITSKNLKPDGLSFDDVKLISDADYRKINERSAVHKGDVLFAMIGTIGNPTVVEVEPDFAIKNVALFKVPNGQSGHYLRYYLSSQGVVSKMQSEAKGTTQKFVGLGYLRAFPVTVPPPVEQVALVRQLDDLAAETGRLEVICQQKLSALDEIKKSLLLQAFTGQLTAKSTDQQLEAVA